MRTLAISPAAPAKAVMKANPSRKYFPQTTSGYATYGTAVKPAGQRVVGRSFTEATFLDTLVEIGIVELLVNEN